MGDVLYIQTDKNRKITDPHVRLGDISDLTSNNPEVLQRCKVLRVLTLESGKYGRYAVSVMKLIELIQKKEKQVEVVHVGEPQFILTYEDPAGKSERMSWLKTAFVCLVTFFGTMFSIMTFNTDVDIPKLFERISSQFTSDPRGLAILEVTYSGDGEQKGEQFRMREIFLGMLGLCMGTTIASGVVAFIISLGIVPRFAGITGSAAQVRLYEECSMLGAVLGNVVFLYQRALPLGNPGLAVYGSFSGIFLGSWVVALGEVVNIYAILIRRIGLVKGIGLVILSMALGKVVGSLWFFFF